MSTGHKLPFFCRRLPRCAMGVTGTLRDGRSRALCIVLWSVVCLGGVFAVQERIRHPFITCKTLPTHTQESCTRNSAPHRPHMPRTEANYPEKLPLYIFPRGAGDLECVPDTRGGGTPPRAVYGTTSQTTNPQVKLHTQTGAPTIDIYRRRPCLLPSLQRVPLGNTTGLHLQGGWVIDD